ncbi:MAG: pilus assembly protein TadG-related protein [Pseudomonadota bacterium]
MFSVALSRLGGLAARLWKDTDGMVLPYVTVMLTLFVGMGALAIDAAQYMSLQTQLQKAADAAAIAAAEELDRLSTSTTRAYNAATSLVSNSPLFASGNVAISTVKFMSSLPASDNTAITSYLCSGTTCSQANSVAARFVEVTVVPVTMPTIFPVNYLFGTGTNSVTTGAQAVAGSDGVSCAVVPIFICNPFEQPGDTYDQATKRLEDANANPAARVQLIRMASGGSSGTWGPGDFGYLAPVPAQLPADPGHCFAGGTAGSLSLAMATSTPQTCVRQNGINLQPGNDTNAKRGLNTRFGQYSHSSSSTCTSAFPPDQNVRTGYVGSACNGSPDTGAWPPGDHYGALPADACLQGSSSCSPIANLGAAQWNCAIYWTANHPSTHPAPSGCTTTAAISRYSVYQYEITNNYLSDPNTYNGGTGEVGAPQCGPPTAGRRMLDVAIVNCGSSPVTVQSNAQNVPVAAFGTFFLTVAVPDNGTSKPYAEFTGLVQRGTAGGKLFDEVQLYR